MQICIFEDKKSKNFEPLTLSRPVYDLLFGTKTLRERIVSTFSSLNHSLHCRDYLAEALRENESTVKVNLIVDTTCLFINGRVLEPERLLEIPDLLNSSNNRIYKNENDDVVAFFLHDEVLDQFIMNMPDTVNSVDLKNVEVRKTKIECAEYLWDLIYLNGEKIHTDFLKLHDIKNNIVYTPKSVHLVNEQKIFISEGVTLKPGVVLDASNGAIIIDDGASINSNAVIEGPVYIGKNSKINTGAYLYDAVSIGEVCKIGGEVEQSIFMPYSNKQHAGFIGHSFIGSWVNLGADTNCSDLKNNYTSVKIKFEEDEIDTGKQFLGVLIGDHSKTSINFMFNTGTIVGYSCNLFGEGFPPKYIPSFSWGGAKGFSEYDVDKSISTIKTVMKRREKELKSNSEKLVKALFDKSEKARKDFIK